MATSNATTMQLQAKEYASDALSSVAVMERPTRRRARRLWDQIEDEELVASVDAQWLADLCMAASGGVELRARLRERVANSRRSSMLSIRLHEVGNRGFSRPSLDRQRRAVDAVVRALCGMMCVDGEVHSLERRLVSQLSRDYCSRFAPDVQPQEPQEYGTIEALEPLTSVQWTPAESRWILDACELVMAADTIARDTEKTYLEQLRQALAPRRR